VNIRFTNPGYLAVVFLVLRMATSSFAQPELTLDDCLKKVRIATAENQQINLTTQAVDLQRKILSRNFWPQVNLGGKATWQSEVTRVPIDIPNFDIPTVPRDQYSAALDINQLIYDGGTTRALNEVQMAESDLRINQLEAGLLSADQRAIDLYFQILLQENLKQNATLLSGQLEQTLIQAEKLLNAGVIDKKDVLAIQVKSVETSQKIMAADYYIRMAKQSLGDLMNEPDTSFQVLADPWQPQEIQRGFSMRPEVQSMEVKNRLLVARNQLNDARVKPTLATFINAGYGRPGLNFLSDQFDFFALAGIKINVPVDHLFTRKKNYQNQVNTLEMEQTRLMKEDLLRNFKLVENYHLDEIGKLKAWLIEDDQILDLRTQMLEVSRSQWEGGIITTTEYLGEVTELSLAGERKKTHQIMLIREEARLLNLYGVR
jgi:outer membrane protein TolC